jgi:Ca2+-binding RTX toxin-like protein
MVWNNGLTRDLGGGNDSYDMGSQWLWDVMDNAFGSTGNDTIHGNGVDNTVRGGVGGDLLFGDDGNDSLFGNDDNDKLNGEDGNDLLGGGADNDSLYGGNGNDTVDGDSGNDTLSGGYNNDRMVGDTGNDVFNDLEGIDTLIGGSGFDTADYSDYYGRIVVNLENGTARQDEAVWHVDQGYVYNSEGTDSLTSIEDVIGTMFGDSITGSTADNHLFGESGSDSLSGAAGNDTLEGGSGRDSMTGGTGTDWFVLDTAPGSSNFDSISDFHAGEDRIVLDNSVFTALGGDGALSSAAFRVVDTPEPTGLDASDRLIFSTWNGFLFFDPDGSGAQAAVAIADLNANTVGNISAADFLIV